MPNPTTLPSLFALTLTLTLSSAQNSTSTYPPVPTTNSTTTTTPTCYDGLKMFVSRGTDESPGVGDTGRLVDQIAQRIPDSSIEAIDYPASGDNPNYFVSVANGTAAVKRAVSEYARACPEGRVALFGYSQGAQITSNALCGMPAVWSLYGGADYRDVDELRAFSDPLPTNVTSNVITTILFGDPTHSANSPHNHGSAASGSSKGSRSGGSGVFTREETGSCDAYGDRIRSYCSSGDPFCDVGDEISATAHLEYVDEYGEEVVSFVGRTFEGTGEGGDGEDEGEEEAAPAATTTAQASEGSRGFGVEGWVGLVAVVVAWAV